MDSSEHWVKILTITNWVVGICLVGVVGRVIVLAM